MTTVPTKITEKSNIQIEKADGTFSTMSYSNILYSNKNITIKQIATLAEKVRQNLITKGFADAKLQMGFVTEDGVHRTGKFVNISEQTIHIYNPDDFTYSVTNQDQLKMNDWYDSGNGKPAAFWFNVMQIGKEGGIGDKNNDCLYNCLEKLVNGKIKEEWKYPSDLKNFLRLKRTDLIHVDHIDQIEKRLNVQIFIGGDVTRNSKINSKTLIHLNLINQHYSIAEESKSKRVAGVSFKERQPVSYHYDYTNDNYIMYDGVKTYTETTAAIIEMKKNTLSCPHILLKVANKDELVEEYNTFISEADGLKLKTKGLVNMYKSGNLKATADSLFRHYTRHLTSTDTIKGLEAMFIQGTYRTGIRYSLPYEGEAYLYDINSMYPHIMKSSMTFPYKEGELLKITQSDFEKCKDKDGNQYFKYGIYRCTVSGDINTILFKENKENKYTHIDLLKAYQLKYTITLIEDDECNFLYYDGKTRISGKQLFGDYIGLLFDIKKNHKDITYAKKLLNILWGLLCEKQIKKKYTTLESNEIIKFPYNEQIVNLQILGKDKKNNTKMKIETMNNNNIYVSGFARISPFLTAQGRNMLSSIISENVRNMDTSTIKRIHTDSILSSIKLKDTFPTKKDSDIGDLGYEGYYKSCSVKNMRLPVGDFIKS